MEEEEKENEERSYHFTCRQCDFGTDVVASNRREAVLAALRLHDDYHSAPGSFHCCAGEYDLD